MRFDNYLIENKEGLGITFVDIDDTLFNTFAMVKVIKNGKVIKSLTTDEYYNYKAKEGETYDVSDYQNSQLFYDTSIPIKPMFKRISNLIRRADAKGSKVVLLTARKVPNDISLFRKKFKDEGLPIDNVELVNISSGDDASLIPNAKKKAILKYLYGGLYRRVRLFDDLLTTCKTFVKIKDNVPQEILNKIRERYELDVSDEELITFEAYNVQKDGSVKKV